MSNIQLITAVIEKFGAEALTVLVVFSLIALIAVGSLVVGLAIFEVAPQQQSDGPEVSGPSGRRFEGWL